MSWTMRKCRFLCFLAVSPCYDFKSVSASVSKCHIFHWGARYCSPKYIAYVSLFPSYLPRISVTGPFFIREDTLGLWGGSHSRLPTHHPGIWPYGITLVSQMWDGSPAAGLLGPPHSVFCLLKYPALGLWQVSLPLAVPFSFLWIPFFAQFISREDFPHSSAGKESACHAGDPSQFLSWKDPLEEGKATHSSILAWRISRTVYVHGVAKSLIGLSDLQFHFHFCLNYSHWHKAVQCSAQATSVCKDTLVTFTPDSAGYWSFLCLIYIAKRKSKRAYLLPRVLRTWTPLEQCLTHSKCSVMSLIFFVPLWKSVIHSGQLCFHLTDENNGLTFVW